MIPQIDSVLPSLEIQELSRRALKVLEQTDLLLVIADSLNVIADLKFCLRTEFSEQHVICQLLAHKIRNIAVQNPQDNSFRRAHRQVCTLLGVSYDPTSVCEEPFWDSSDTVISRRDNVELPNDPEYSRIIHATKRLRG